jgi:hypothetical protein
MSGQVERVCFELLNEYIEPGLEMASAEDYINYDTDYFPR